MTDTGYPSTPSPRTDVAASSPSSSAQVRSFSSFRSGALLLPSRGHRRRRDPACSPPSRARYGVRLPRRVIQRTTTDAKATPNGSSGRRTTFWLGDANAQEIPAPRHFKIIFLSAFRIISVITSDGVYFERIST
jgi:hypothetical protein